MLLVGETVVLGVVLVVEVVVGLLVVVGMGGTKSVGKRSFSLFSLIVVLVLISLVFIIVVDVGVDSLVILTRVSENRGCSVFVGGLNVRDELSLSVAVPFVLVENGTPVNPILPFRIFKINISKKYELRV